jgi:hypothetical protein
VAVEVEEKVDIHLVERLKERGRKGEREGERGLREGRGRRERGRGSGSEPMEESARRRVARERGE